LIVLVALVLDFVQRRVARHFKAVVEATENLWDDALFHALVKPLSLIIWLLGITLAMQAIPARAEGHLLAGGLVAAVREIGLLVALTWFLLRLVKGIELNVIETARRQERQIDRDTVTALSRIVRITIIVTSVLIGMDALGFQVSGLLAAGGIGGLAVGLAAKDMLANFFGGLTVFIDRPFSLGDWVVLQDKGIEGVVENIGWRQTIIRKFDKRPIYVPNATFTTIAVENPSRMSHRRINETIGMRYDDIGRMEAVVDDVRNMLKEHPEIDQSQTLMVQFNRFSDSSLDFFIYCLTHTVNWQRYHEVKQDVLLKIAGIIDRHGAEIAYPTRTLMMESTPELAGLETQKRERQ
jgi:MscS family membrane protein